MKHNTHCPSVRVEFNNSSEDLMLWTTKKLMRMAKQHHEELTEMFAMGIPTNAKSDPRDIERYDELADALNNIAEELRDRGYWVEGVNEQVLVITKPEEDEDE